MSEFFLKLLLLLVSICHACAAREETYLCLLMMLSFHTPHIDRDCVCGVRGCVKLPHAERINDSRQFHQNPKCASSAWEHLRALSSECDRVCRLFLRSTILDIEFEESRRQSAKISFALSEYCSFFCSLRLPTK